MEIEVISSGASGWVVLEFGVERAFFERKRPAERAARRIAKQHGLTLTIRRENGTTQERRTYPRNNGW